MILTPRHRQDTKVWLRLLVAFAAALVVHALMVLVVILTPSSPPVARAPRAESKPVVLRGLSLEQWQKNRGQDSSVKDERKVIARAKPKEEKKPEVRPDGQVVDVAPGNDQVAPDAEYVAETNNAVKKQTRAREQTAFYKNAMPNRTSTQPVDGAGADAVAAAQKSGNDGVGDDDRPVNTETPRAAMEIPDTRRRDEVKVRPDTDGPGVPVANRTGTEEIRGNSDRLNLQPGAPEAGEAASAGRVGKTGVVSLLPSPAVLDRITGAAPNDLLRDVDEGDGTFLNTKEWKYASFFNRVKQSVGQQWAPMAELTRRDPSGTVYSGRDRYTVLAVTLDEQGRLRDAYVEKSSGLDFLDLEAIRAFERAQPFPNPPPGLLAADATIRFQFGFFVEMTGRPGMRLFRGPN